MGSSFTPPRDLRDYLEDFGICTLAQARNQTPFASGYWFSAEDLDLVGEWKALWDNFIRGLDYGRIRLSDQNDSLIWSHNNYIGPLIAAEGYDYVFSDSCSEISDSVLDFIWTLNIPLKIACFTWLLTRGKILTWDQLQIKGFNGPGHCVLCEGNLEDIHHLFFFSAHSLCVFSHISRLSIGAPFPFLILSCPFWISGLIPLRVQLHLDTCLYLFSGVFGSSGIFVYLKKGDRHSQLLSPGLRVF